MDIQRIEWPEDTYKSLDDYIRNLVKSIHFLGIETLMSCEGHIRTSWIYSGILPWPWIILLTTEERLDDLVRRIESWNNMHSTAKKWILSEKRIHGSFTPEYIQSLIIRNNPGYLARALVPKCENIELSQRVLTLSQVQANELARFLQEPSA